jgi:hypothetical protein
LIAKAGMYNIRSGPFVSSRPVVAVFENILVLLKLLGKRSLNYKPKMYCHKIIVPHLLISADTSQNLKVKFMTAGRKIFTAMKPSLVMLTSTTQTSSQTLPQLILIWSISYY